MPRSSALRAVLLVLVLVPSAIAAQSSQSVSSAAVPRLIEVTGVFRPADGLPAGPVETVTLSIYADEEGGVPLWQETQTIAMDAQGRYSLLLGATSPDGIPAAVFGSEAHWLGTRFERAREVEGSRMRLTSVPYAIRAADADTLGGRPASAYLLAPNAGGKTSAEATAVEPGGSANTVLPGTTDFLAKYVNGVDVGSSSVFELAGGSIGMGTNTPFDRLHIRYDNNTGDFTGLAVQNTNGGALAYSGMLFYDHTNALTQFQGYNNSTHEYRINNIARVSPGGAFNGTINFMIGGTSRFFVSANQVGIGTTTPVGTFEVSNALSTMPGGNILATTYGANASGSSIYARKARGTAAAPSAAQNNDSLAFFAGRGYATSGFGSGLSGMTVRAAENFTDTAQGTSLQFSTIATGTNTATTRMAIAANGDIGIGTTTPSGTVEAVRDGDVAAFQATSFGDGCCAGVAARLARRPATGPAAVQLGDPLALFLGDGYGATHFSDEGGGMAVLAAENWTDTAQGTIVAFTTTPLGSTEDAGRMAIMPDGNVGIGTFNSIP